MRSAIPSGYSGFLQVTFQELESIITPRRLKPRHFRFECAGNFLLAPLGLLAGLPKDLTGGTDRELKATA